MYTGKIAAPPAIIIPWARAGVPLQFCCDVLLHRASYLANAAVKVGIVNTTAVIGTKLVQQITHPIHFNHSAQCSHLICHCTVGVFQTRVEHANRKPNVSVGYLVANIRRSILLRSLM